MLLSSDAVNRDLPSLENCTALTADECALNKATSPFLYIFEIKLFIIHKSYIDIPNKRLYVISKLNI